MSKTICILALGVGIGVIGFQLLSTGTLSSVIPIALVLICPLMMLFMGHGMTHKDHSEKEKETL